MKKLSNAMLDDLSRHATTRSLNALQDACQLIDDKALAYVLVLHVLGKLVCSAAMMVPGKKSHSAKIAYTLTHLADVMERHRSHGG